MQGKKFIILTITALCVTECLCSSIPMFEYLSRDEKLTHLYSMFAKQVKDYCKNKNNVNTSQCKRNMMLYGMKKLNGMEEEHLDAMDPYQRDANTILWDSIMENHEDMKTTIPTKKTHQDQRQIYLQKEQLHQQNPIFKDNYEDASSGATDLYENDEHSNYLHHQGAASHNNYAYINKPNDLDNHEYLEQNTNYLMGGAISWMMPDGTALKGAVPYTLPPDDDMRDMTMGQKRKPTMQELLDSMDSMTMDEKPKIIIELPPTQTTTIKPATTRVYRTLCYNHRCY
ncbi:hypothetical protein PVAND_008965 [Polypedilum vanderplanki]|uniref:Uncharacterized protein n=1 Tax=Polypedilum vanderplanki TaxID=319348 RepID=A0A9J6CBU5_POLVA|nr:hypothetical protein PVAND_008965 [Polypedilum vanderplanki]